MTVRKAAFVAIKKQLSKGKVPPLITEHDQADGTHSVTVGERPLLCMVCGHDRYHDQKSLLNTRAGEFFNMAWTDKAAKNYICARCGYIHWFLGQ
jgi:hypothetical protein